MGRFKGTTVVALGARVLAFPLLPLGALRREVRASTLETITSGLVWAILQEMVRAPAVVTLFQRARKNALDQPHLRVVLEGTVLLQMVRITTVEALLRV